MTTSDDMPLLRDLPRGKLPTEEPLVLASASPRRAQLLRAAGYEFEIDPASDSAECGVCSRETAPELVARYAFRKAQDVVRRYQSALVLGADTVASYKGMILGKPRDEAHAESMLRTLSGKRHDCYTGVCLWSAATHRCVVDVSRTELQMNELSEAMLREHLDSMRWEGKAGAFGFQDGNDWLAIVGGGTASNVVGLPMERLVELLDRFDALAETVDADTTDQPSFGG